MRIKDLILIKRIKRIKNLVTRTFILSFNDSLHLLSCAQFPFVPATLLPPPLESFYLMFFLNAKAEREERVRNSKQCHSVPALNIPKAKSQAQSLPFLCLFKIRIPFVLFLDRKKREKGLSPHQGI